MQLPHTSVLTLAAAMAPLGLATSLLAPSGNVSVPNISGMDGTSAPVLATTPPPPLPTATAPLTALHGGITASVWGIWMQCFGPTWNECIDSCFCNMDLSLNCTADEACECDCICKDHP